MTAIVAWESSLVEKIAYVELLGELNLSAEEVRDLGQALAQLVERNGPKSAIDLLRRRYPASLAVYLVKINPRFVMFWYSQFTTG